MERMDNEKLEAQIAKMIARCLYKGIFIYDVKIDDEKIILKYK